MRPDGPRPRTFTKSILSLACAAILAACDEAPPPCCHAAPDAPSSRAALPSDSVLQLSMPWTDQHGQPFDLEDLRGHPTFVAMFFSHCAYACPRLVADLQALDAALTESERRDARYLLVSFDDVRDTPERLAAWAHERGLDERWTLLHGDAAAVRELSAVLGVNYRRVPDSQDFAHANVVTLLDRAGRIVQQQSGLGAPIGPLVDAYRQRSSARASSSPAASNSNSSQ